MNHRSTLQVLGVYLIIIGACLRGTWSFNPCCSFPCENDGVCMEDGEAYTCDCTHTGYYGVNCGTPYWSTWFKSLITPSQETTHYLLTHFSWLWSIVNNVGFIQDTVMRSLYLSRTSFVPVPHGYTSDHEYPTMEAHYNRSLYARTLPPVPKNCPTLFGVAGKRSPPSPEEVAEKLLKRKEFVTDHMNTSLLFMFFALHHSHVFMKTDFANPWFTWGQQGVDVTHIYGQGLERENRLRSFKDGKLKSQMINGEEWPPHAKDVDVFMRYPPNTPDEKKFATGQPVNSLFPGLFMYATIWLREHNRVCRVLGKEHPHWEDEQIFQTAKLIITGELIKIVLEEYVNHITNYNLKLIYKPELLFNDRFGYDNRAHHEFNYVYHWHPFNPDKYNISGTVYSVEEFMYGSDIVVKHGMSKFVDSLSRSLAGKMTHHNHGRLTLASEVQAIKHQRRLRMQSFNNHRKRFGLQPYKSFEEMTGDKTLAAEMEEVYGDVDAVDLCVGLFLEKGLQNSPFGLTTLAVFTPYSLHAMLSNPVSSPTYWKPSTFGGDVGFNLVQTATLEKLFCQNIAGKCPLVKFRVPTDIAREERKVLAAKKSSHDEL